MPKRNQHDEKILIEVAWEVCNQVGGIYTVIRSKIPTAMKFWGDNYALLGPYVSEDISTDFEPLPPDDSIMGKAALKMQAMGLGVHFGCWLVSGRPRTILFDLRSAMKELGKIKYFYHRNHHIQFDHHDFLMDQVLAFGYLVKIYFSLLASMSLEKDIRVYGHFHEWMAGTAIPDIRKEQIPVRTVFTTHATVLGRYLAMNDPCFYDHLPFLNWEYEANNFNVDAIARIERACAHGAHVFTTVSDVTGKECTHLLGRSPDQILPNGFNIQRYGALHEVQNAHQTFKTMIQHFVMGHFFQTYSFDLDKTLFFFTSGRYEYRNKGYDLVLEALARLNWMLKRENAEETIVMFIITKRPVYSINPGVLNSRAVMQEIDRNCDLILEQVKERLFNYAASTPSNHKLPDLND
ncbi:MAG: glycogen synthase, partial [Bacteroidota bacterium]